MKKILLLCFVSVLLFPACIESLDRDLETHSLDFNVVKKSAWFKQDVVDVMLETYRNTLTIKLSLNCPPDFPFPVDPVYKDTLTETRFLLTFLKNGTPVVTDSLFNGIPMADGYMDTTTAKITSVSKYLRGKGSLIFRIPLYVFYNLKSGEQELYLSISQETFTREKIIQLTDTTTETITLEQKKNLINGLLRFKITIPDIYKTTIFENSIVIRNDETYSPHSADFALFGPGLPDVYWQIYFPAASANDYSFPYCRSSEMTNVEVYTNKDQFALYHYKPDENLKIGVYDRDDLSRDDVMGNWFGKISSLKASPGRWKYLSFDNVKSFELRAESAGCINKK